MLFIPAIDLRGGACVRLYQGDFNAETRYPVEPEALLYTYRELGASWLHVVDLDGAKSGIPTNMPLIARLAREGVRLQVGGGMRSAYVIEAALGAGVERVVVGSAAVDHPVTVIGWLKRFGPERICLAFDVRVDEHGTPRVHTHGWTQRTAISLWHALRIYPPRTVRHVLCTDIERDGALCGPNLELYRSARERHPEYAWQASGGVRGVRDLEQLAECGVAAAVSGKALLDQKFTPQEIRQFSLAESSPASTSATAKS